MVLILYKLLMVEAFFASRSHIIVLQVQN